MKEFLRRNSSTILTCIGAVGVVATAVMAVKATPKALDRIEKAEEEKGEELTKFEIVNVAGPAYIPAVITGLGTVACIFGANVINQRQQASLMSAYALLDNSYKEYKNKVEELYGEDANQRIRAEIAKDKYAGDGKLEDDSKELFYDYYSGRYFESTTENVARAEYMTNRQLYVDGCVSLNDYYAYLGLHPCPEYDEIGWTCQQLEEMYWHPWIDFDHEKTEIDESFDGSVGLECTIISISQEPVMGYLDYC